MTATRGNDETARIAALGDEIAEAAAHIDAATHRLLTRIREFDECNGWYQAGAVSCAHWLSWRIGLTGGTAREKVRVARALGELPRIDAALGRGEISYSKVRAMTRVATPENEEMLLEMAYASTGAQLEKICRLYRGVQQAEDGKGTRDVDERRWVTSDRTDDGMMRLTAQLTVDEAGRVMAAIDAAAADASAGTPDRNAGRADGLVSLAEAYARGETSKSPVELVVTIDQETLTSATGTADCAGEPISAETARRINGRAAVRYDDRGGDRSAGKERRRSRAGCPSRRLDAASTSSDPRGRSRLLLFHLTCDAGVVPIVVDGDGNPLDIGRRSRSIPAPIRRAMRLRDGGCTFPGCTNHRWIDGHHIQHWSDRGETRLENLTSLCDRHHRFVHEQGYTVELGPDGTATFRDEAGHVVPSQPPRLRGSATAVARANADAGLHIDPHTNFPGWDGLTPDYDLCVDALVSTARAT
jgi:hypothetical protein